MQIEFVEDRSQGARIAMTDLFDDVRVTYNITIIATFKLILDALKVDRLNTRGFCPRLMKNNKYMKPNAPRMKPKMIEPKQKERTWLKLRSHVTSLNIKDCPVLYKLYDISISRSRASCKFGVSELH